ncbi:uncharacterized protein LOC110188443 [Drosophila serrata]|uniref:uncharacterized protein LOC110188443 n=1 Tax=Drosophila serrata TaxID=7274 RepID=UPI000A1D2C6E|nr:uncharacterized protein LOC110188443 [Drosophila serrata]
MWIVGVSYWSKVNAQNQIQFIVIACVRKTKELQVETYIVIQDFVDHILPGESAATGEMVAKEPDIPKYPMDMASMTPLKKGPLRMRFRLGNNPRCEFVNGEPADPAVPSIQHPTISED